MGETGMPCMGRVGWRRLRPSVNRRWLWLISGLMWWAVGMMLCGMAAKWLAGLAWPVSASGLAVGLGAGILIYRFGFSRIARRNITRIENKPDQVCLFAFQAWKSYLLILLMMALGYGLRSSQMPRLIIAVIYSAIGTGLTLSSSLYFLRFF